LVKAAMTFKDLKKRVSLELSQQSMFFEKLHNKPFGFGILSSTKQQGINNKQITFLRLTLFPYSK
jgi:hypothetical protein